MPETMLHEITLISFKWKLLAPVLALAFTVFAEAALPLDQYERLGVMGLGVLIIGYLVRAVAEEQRISRAERETARKEREAFQSAIAANTAATEAIVAQQEKAITALLDKELKRP